MVISERLAALADMVHPCDVVADIGCDHGHLARHLLETGRAQSVIATDISAPSLQKAQAALKPFGNAASVRLGAGLEVLSVGEAHTIVIAGMGGHEIMSILQKSPEQARQAVLVLGPHRDVPLVRAYLFATGFAIREERVALDRGVWYTLLRAAHGSQRMPYTPIEMQLGRLNNVPQDLKKAYCVARRENAQSVLEKLRSVPTAQQKTRELECLIEQIEQILDEGSHERPEKGQEREYERTRRSY